MKFKKKRDAQIIKPHQTPADYTLYNIHKKRKDYCLNPLSASSLPYSSTLARLIIFHQLKEQLYSDLLHMLMNQLRDVTENWLWPSNGAGRRFCSVEV